MSVPNKKLLVIYHSHTGGTEQMVRAFSEAADLEPGVEVICRHATQTEAHDVLTADGLVFATPENLASMSGLLKDFFDRTYYQVLDRINGRPYCILICAGSDGTGAARQIERIATGWRLNLIQPALIINTGAQTPEAILAPKKLSQEQLKQCSDFGALFAAGLAMAVF